MDADSVPLPPPLPPLSPRSFKTLQFHAYACYYSALCRVVSGRQYPIRQVVALYGHLASAEHRRDLLHDIKLEEAYAEARHLAVPTWRPSDLTKQLRTVSLCPEDWIEVERLRGSASVQNVGTGNVDCAGGCSKGNAEDCHA